MTKPAGLWHLHPPSFVPAPHASLRAFMLVRGRCRMNILAWLHRQIGESLQPFFLFPIVCRPTAIRRPDIALARGPFKRHDWLLEHPVLTIDLLPPGTQEASMAHRLCDYETSPTIRHCLMVELDRPRVLVYGRGADIPVETRGLENAVELPGCSLPPLPMALIYENFAERLRETEK